MERCMVVINYKIRRAVDGAGLTAEFVRLVDEIILDTRIRAYKECEALCHKVGSGVFEAAILKDLPTVETYTRVGAIACARVIKEVRKERTDGQQTADIRGE